MPNHTITNATTSIVDMSPLHDLLGHRLTLKAGESRDVDDATFHNDIVQRVVSAGWVKEGKPVAKAPAPVEPPKAPEAKTPEPPPAPVEPPAAPATEAPASMPIETPTSSETPLTPRTTTKQKK